MIIVLKTGATEQDVERVSELLRSKGLGVHVSQGIEKTIIGVIGAKERVGELAVESLECVEKVVSVSNPFKLASRDFHPLDTVISVGNLKIGGPEPVYMAGPCSVESRTGMIEIAQRVKEAGAHILRGGAFKPRSSPYSFQGLGEEGLKYMAEAREITGLPIISEVMEPETVNLMVDYVDILQIGARNMQNYALLRAVGRTQTPVLLKRGFSNTIEEWLMSAEYILSEGNPNVILCERGIRTFETYTRNTLDLNAVPVVKHLSHLPVIVDPSHGVGKWRYVTAMSRAAMAAGAHGLIVEVHPNPQEALSDGPQSLTLENFENLIEEVNRIVRVLNPEVTSANTNQ
ncbi:3-deoxy-7-phosphoheptulonate synthase [Alicyclobacillus tolerans]|uniref:3-deoxy-D-arabinoheptulosonate-7-phosphate synthase n=2 Tax=Alicyclobacillus tolerans TaxID=90970 RepID=A0A1M6MPQ0_9BACL|nr:MULTISPECIES: 3-deoxy-7-phosphoheptulonate synthase [Alicyclobacillus]MDP9728143.1 3-deoxy-7-phosphoheptulonate synthase [Alicyclobacillus tengchongensis]QRF23368.1 3-deoxy-7-phosphoheptulonate synthase [Alicyclobacillus sp. TC]SHJ85485.1 3-deoxy-D-arabinoheptulosonate-7-phosphate synthase [Alicyclobacillus montanus]